MFARLCRLSKSASHRGTFVRCGGLRGIISSLLVRAAYTTFAARLVGDVGGAYILPEAQALRDAGVV
jgi:hypothetical protein